MSAPTPASFLASLATRRSIYTISKALPEGITQTSFQELVYEAVKQSPSAFNSQSARVVILFGADNAKLWSLVWDKVLAAAHFADDAARSASEKRVANFSTGAGTILFFEDQDVVDQSIASFPSYAASIPAMSENSSGILQGNVWTLLALAGIGASLQHYSNLIESDVHKTWDLPSSWKLKAQMPFGAIAGPAIQKVKTGKERVTTFGADAE